MKKLAVTLMLSAALFCTAGAANVGTIDNKYPGDTEAQAQMLCDLGLFRGTDKGFELEKPMTRAEAAVMLTRLLGAEDEALAGTAAHPFTDVPQWAAPYVGWLYENGLTKGVSAAQYGARQNVTCGQYAVLLSRMAYDNDDYRSFVNAEEVEACDAAGFVRGDAVSLSAGMLGVWTYRENWSGTLAQSLVRDGVFTPDELRAAAWDVLPREYESQQDMSLGAVQNRQVPSCTIMGVVVQQNTDREARIVMNVEGYFPTETLYADTAEGTLYLVDRQTLAVTALATLPGIRRFDTLGCMGQTDYLVARGEAAGYSTVLAVKDDEVRVLPMRMKEGKPYPDYDETSRCIVFVCDQGLCVLNAEGERVINTLTGEELADVQDGRIVTQNVTAKETTVLARTLSGVLTDIYTVPNDSPARWVENGRNITDAPRLKYDDRPYLWGDAGMYKIENGHLNQITARAVYGYMWDETDNSYVLITRDVGKRVEYTEYAVPVQTGDTLVRLHADGTETALLPELPEGSLLLGEVTGAADGKVTFTTLKAAEPHYMSRFTCVLENGRIRVTGADAGITMIYGENAVAEEQQRLDSLGVGVGAA